MRTTAVEFTIYSVNGINIRCLRYKHTGSSHYNIHAVFVESSLVRVHIGAAYDRQLASTVREWAMSCHTMSYRVAMMGWNWMGCDEGKLSACDDDLIWSRFLDQAQSRLANCVYTATSNTKYSKNHQIQNTYSSAPTKVTTENLWNLQSEFASTAIWSASSRVGDRIIIMGGTWGMVWMGVS